ncbi:hypothetical protein CHS0354_009118 [Potamilus streckersoni]|uniref:Mitochondrial assembly of ribosomal large subunit protein 1 n=1 Tax=Potamilus streckersoni TaxID=2493646 RepID=A0AAE0SS12_9BIVA|nr:hypothetical protein CHS0354_009118 [Potamilus streckersoni]
MALIIFNFNRICHHQKVLYKLMFIRYCTKRSTSHTLRQGISCCLRPPAISIEGQINLYCKQNLSPIKKINASSSFSVIYNQSNQDDIVSITNHQQILPYFSRHHKKTLCADHFSKSGCLFFAQRRNNHILHKEYQSTCFRTVLNKINTVRSFSDLKKDEELKSLLNEIMDDFKDNNSNESSTKKDSDETSKDNAEDMETNVEGIQISSERGKLHNTKEKGDSFEEQKFNTAEVQDKFSKSCDDSTVLQESETSSTSSESDEEIEDFVSGENEEEVQEELEPPWTPPISLIRGTSGVFELDELMVVLRESNAIDICALRLPPEARLAEYMVIVSGTSLRHILAIALEIRKIHKKKKGPRDHHLVIEGMNSNDWLAMNLGNIILHIFLPETRAVYDLELLWTVGEKYDDLCQKQQQESYTMSIDDLPWLKELENSKSSNKEQASKSGKTC